MLRWLILLLIVAGLLWALYHWLFVITEGVYLGRRAVVWLYDVTAATYDQIKRYQLGEERVLLVEPILGELRDCPQPLLLDVGTGTGRVPYFLLADGRFSARGGRIVGLDASPGMLRYAASNLQPFAAHVGLVQQVAAALPFATATFDMVTSLEALEFFPSDEQAMREMVRVLKPNGCLMVTRRCGWEAKTFIGRYRTRAQFTHWLEDMGLVNAVAFDWQTHYDLAVAVKKAQK